MGHRRILHCKYEEKGALCLDGGLWQLEREINTRNRLQGLEESWREAQRATE